VLWELTLGDERIEPHYIVPPIIFSVGPIAVHFRLLALEEDDKRLADKLKTLEAAGPIKFHARGGLHDTTLDGFCKLVNLSIQSDETQAPVKYRISGSLELVR
jgi:hypothetical protein